MPGRDQRRLRGAEIAVVLRDPALNLNPVLRVGFQVEEVVRAHRPWPSRRRREQVEAALGEVGLGGDPHQLSGG
jgi:ABC-type glutathione transport system ATPase component